MEKEDGKGKVLQHSEKYFQGYWVQLQSRIRKEDDADELLEGTLSNPLEELRNAWNAHHENPRPANDVIDARYNTGASVSKEYNMALCIKTLYNGTTYGEPPGHFPPTLEQINKDPLKHIKDFSLATAKGTLGGQNPAGRNDAASRAWVRTAYTALVKYRKACKFIWDTALATLTSAQATTIIAGLPFGSGPALLSQIENQQQRQTTMALFTLFSQLISLQLNSGENFSGVHSG